MSEDEKLDGLLDRWNDGFEPDSDLSSRVRVAVGQREPAPSRADSLAYWFGNVFSRPGLVAGFAALFVLVGVGVSQLVTVGVRSESFERTMSYRLSIDPLYRLQAMAGVEEFAREALVPTQLDSEGAPVLRAGLGWLQGELDLSEPQYRKVSELHGTYEDQFADLFGELLASHRAYRELDKRRMSSDVIDYFQFYELLQTQRQLSEKSARLTEALLGEVEGVIDPAQRARYRELISKIYPGFSRSETSKTDA